jgi:amino acid transporter
MAAAAFASTASTLIIALAAVPRMIMVLARDGLFFGGWSPVFARVHPRTGSPLAATLLVGALYLGVACGDGSSLQGVYAAAYLFFFRYLVLHLLALLNCRHNLHRAQRTVRCITLGCAVAGIGLTLTAWYLAFSGRHAAYSATAGTVAAGALVLALAAWCAQRSPVQAHRPTSYWTPVVRIIRGRVRGMLSLGGTP